jgi:hypothetical protein
MITKYIHIGYPKNFSTSLQRDYFSKHPELFHLGIGIDSNLGYRDSMVEKTFEVYLKTCKEFKYREVKEKVKSHFSKLFQNAEKNYQAVGISSEHLSFAFTHDGLSAQEKCKRLLDLFGKETKIIMVIRNQMDLIKSLFRESVRVGFPGDFEDYLDSLYKYQDRNFVYDFRYDLMYELYAKYFGKQNIKVLFFENYRKENNTVLDNQSVNELFGELNSFLGVNNIEMKLSHYNEAIPSDKILIKSLLNKKEPHDLGNHLMESAEKHRIKSYLEEDLTYFEIEEETYSDVIKKRELTTKALKGHESLPLNFNSKLPNYKKLQHFFAEGNFEFEKNSGFNLPEKYKQFPE